MKEYNKPNGGGLLKILKASLKVIGYAVGALFGVGLIYYLYTVVKMYIFLIFGFITACVLFPIMMRHGVKTVLKERDSVYAQLSHNMPVRYNKGTTFRGFVEILLLLWIIIPPIMLIPGGLAVAVVPVVSVAIFIVEGLTANIWSEIGWSKGLYWLMNIGIYVLGLVLGAVLNELIY